MERLPDLDEFVKARVVRAASNGANLIYFAVVSTHSWEPRRHLTRHRSLQTLHFDSPALYAQVEKGGARVGFKEVAADRAVVRPQIFEIVFPDA